MSSNMATLLEKVSGTFRPFIVGIITNLSFFKDESHCKDDIKIRDRHF